MMDQVKIALVGCGKMGQHHLKEMSHVDTPHQIVGFYDSNAYAAEKLASQWGVPAFDSIQELCSSATPDIVHICTPPDFHFEQAMEVLEAGVNLYVEKPFVQTAAQAKVVLSVAKEKNLLVCAGFQQVYDPAFLDLMESSTSLVQPLLVESRFNFKPARFSVKQATKNMLGEQLLDILPHPLYTMVCAIETLLPTEASKLEVKYIKATCEEVFVVFECGQVRAQLAVSLILRPVESTLKIGGENGALTADFVRGIVHGNCNAGTQALEKILNPPLEGFQLQVRSTASLIKRLAGGESYPGLAKLFDRFYSAVAGGAASPISDEHILSVVSLYELLAGKIRASFDGSHLEKKFPLSKPAADTPIVLVTGAGGLLGSRICKELVDKKFYVRGTGRTNKSTIVSAHDWISSDLSLGLPKEALIRVDTIIHAAAETSGGFEEHQRNSIDATINLLKQASEAGVKKFVFVSSLAVLEPKWWRSDPLTEDSPRVLDPKSMGPYIWGKSTSESDVQRLCDEMGIEYRIVRPAALLDYSDEILPGRLGKKLFGKWYMGLGRGGLPFTACEVATAGKVLAWYAASFEQSPKTLNLIDGTIESRREVINRYRQHDWTGRVIWIPISILASAMWLITGLIDLLKRKRSNRVSAWKILKPRSYDSSLARQVIDESTR